MRKTMNRQRLEKFAQMAAESYTKDPVHVYATKSEERRKKFLYHFLIERLATSNREDIIYFDEEDRGICVFRKAHNDYTLFDFLLCPNWVFLVVYLSSTIRTLSFFSHLKPKRVFDKNTYLISPVFVHKEHQGKGIATQLITKGVNDLVAQGYNIGLETQNPDNVPFYEKLGFKVIEHNYYEKEKIHNYYMLYNK